MEMRRSISLHVTMGFTNTGVRLRFRGTNTKACTGHQLKSPAFTRPPMRPSRRPWMKCPGFVNRSVHTQTQLRTLRSENARCGSWAALPDAPAARRRPLDGCRHAALPGFGCLGARSRSPSEILRRLAARPRSVDLRVYARCKTPNLKTGLGLLETSGRV